MEFVQELFDPFSIFSVSKCLHLLLVLRQYLKDELLFDFILKLFETADLYSSEIETMSLVYEFLSTFNLTQYSIEFLTSYINQSMSILQHSFSYFAGTANKNENVTYYFSKYKFDIISDESDVLDSNYLIFSRLLKFLLSFPPSFYHESSIQLFCSKFFKVAPDVVSMYFLKFWNYFPLNLQDLFFESYPQYLPFINKYNFPGHMCSLIVQIPPHRFPNEKYSQRFQYLQELTLKIFPKFYFSSK